MMMPERFKALGDPVRLRLFQLLAGCDELCVCHLTEALDLPQSTVSRHLGVLRHAGLVQTRREGKWMYYRLTDALANRLAALIHEFSTDELFQKDRERLQCRDHNFIDIST